MLISRSFFEVRDLSTDPRSWQHYRSYRFVTCHYLLAIICGTPCVDNFKKSSSSCLYCCLLGPKSHETSNQHDHNACRKGSLQVIFGKRWWSMQDIFYNSKISSCFPIFDTGNAWQMGHNSQEDFFLGKNCYWTLICCLARSDFKRL